MSVGDFLFQGQAPIAAPTGSDTSTAFPLWLQQAIYGTVSGAADLAQTAYNPFPGPLVAAPSDATTAAQGLASSNVGNWGPYVGSAGALNTSAANAAQNAQAQAVRNGGMWSPYLGQAGALTANAAGATAGAQSQIAQNYGNWSPYLSAASDLTGAAASPLDAGAIAKYLNPEQSYITGALNTNLMQNILPGVRDRFVGAGQSGSPQDAELTSQAIYGTQQAAGQALAGAYDNATRTALAEQGAGLAAGQQYGALGTMAANLAGGQTGQALQAAGQQAGIGQQYGALGQYAQQFGMNDINSLLSTAGAETGVAQQGESLGALTSQLGAVDVGQLSASGQQQDTMRQANINAALNQFQQQQQWPYQNVAYLSDIVRGIPVQAAGSTTQTAGTTYPSAYGPSAFSSFLGSAGLSSALGLAKGGHIRLGALNRAVMPQQHKRAPVSAFAHFRKAA